MRARAPLNIIDEGLALFWGRMALAYTHDTGGLDLISRVSACIKSDPREAQRYLNEIREHVPILLEKLKQQEIESIEGRDELEREEASLMRKIGEKEREKENLRSEIREIERNKARYEAGLDDAKSDLASAKSKKSKAESDKGAAIGGAVGGGVGAVVLGILFPPSLAVTVPAVATSVTIAIKEAEKAIDRAKERISDAQSDISRENRRISAANEKINNIQREISTLIEGRDDLHNQVGKMRKKVVFLQQAVTFFGKLQVSVRSGGSETQLLHDIVDMANKEEEYEVLGSDGCISVVHSFGAAWKKVEEQVMKGTKSGFMGIECSTRAHLQL